MATIDAHGIDRPLEVGRNPFKRGDIIMLVSGILVIVALIVWAIR